VHDLDACARLSNPVGSMAMTEIRAGLGAGMMSRASVRTCSTLVVRGVTLASGIAAFSR